LPETTPANLIPAHPSGVWNSSATSSSSRWSHPRPQWWCPPKSGSCSDGASRTRAR